MLLLLAYMVDDIDEIAHIGASEGSESKVRDKRRCSCCQLVSSEIPILMPFFLFH